MENFNQINVENLLIKIELFYKKFYINKLMKGIFISFGVVLAFFIIFDLAFFYGAFPDFIRFSLFYIFILVLLSSFYFWIIQPILKLLKLSQGISNEESAEYIGLHYNEIGDKLLNTLQYNLEHKTNDLAQAAVLQKAMFFEPFDFSNAVPPINNNKRVFLFIVPLSFLIGIFMYNSKVITEGSTRMVNYNVDYSTIAPYSFEISPKNASVNNGSDIKLEVQLIGIDLPDQLFIEIDNVKYRTGKEGNVFSFSAINVSESFSYRFIDGNYKSELYAISVVDNPTVTSMAIVVEYPAYMQKENMLLANPGILEVMEGSHLYWDVDVRNASDFVFLVNDSRLNFSQSSNGNWVKSFKVDASFNFDIELINSLKEPIPVYSGEIVMLKDEYPTIDVKISQEEEGTSYFIGRVSDDFGFRRLDVRFSGKDTSWTKNIPVNKNSQNDVFSYKIDHNSLSTSVSVVFEVRDNDEPNGFKLTRYKPFEIKVLSDNELDSNLIMEGEELIKEMEELSKSSNDLNESLKKLQKDLLNKKSLDWSEERKLEEVIKAEKDLQEKLEKTKQKLDKHQEKINQRKDPNLDILKKQKQLENLFEKLMDEKDKELYKELEELLKKMNKDDIQKHLEKMELNQADIEKELDRNLEIFKQMELEQGLEKSLEKLEEIAKKQKDLAKENKEEKISNEENIEKQEELNKEFDDLKKEMDRLDSLNNELKEPNEFDFEKEKQEEISKDQNEAVKDSKEEKQSESSESQEDAAKKMQEMQEDMEEGMEMSSSSQEGEDLDALRKLLENLLVLSFEQEDLMMELKTLEKNDPRVVSLNQKQKELLQNSEMVKDSLYSLSSRISQIESIITEETKLITKNMGNSVAELAERRVSQSLMYQQKSLTSINNLAVLLDEIIQQLQEQQKKKKKGSGSCSKPGEGKPKPSLKSSKKRQEELAKKIKEMQKKMEKGKSPGKMNPGKMGNGMSKEIAQMAAQQEMIRQEIRKMADELQKEGNMGGAGELKKLEKMLEENEEDIINLELDNEFFARQQQIEIKMLEAQNAERKREKEKRREAETAINFKKEGVNNLEDYFKEKEFELELIRMLNPEMSGYYKNKVQEYNLEVN